MKKSKSPPTTLDSRETLIEAYLKLARKLGVAPITIQMIADEAKVSFGTVRYHFNTEDMKIETEALKYLIQKAYLYLEETIFRDRTEAGFDPIYSYVKNMLTWVHEFPQYSSFLFYYYYQCSTLAEPGIPNEIFLQRALTRIESLLNEGIGLGVYKQVTNKAELSALIHDAILGTSISLGTATKKGPKALEAHIGKCKLEMDLLINGFGRNEL